MTKARTKVTVWQGANGAVHVTVPKGTLARWHAYVAVRDWMVAKGDGSDEEVSAHVSRHLARHEAQPWPEREHFWI